ncbi:hypothetical protein RFI_15555 [Reticulomyxa filosa]|uniref:Uncharacterized protein n=1 Tax=Reticulomyxa filosa TaxID=46433 RepID=X6N6T9_RETFI|nr:hypothetical protein RFI_15555 [Reticulomyxa filosa]|eukprot:ETO21648.1 hypothetical protein RFI_15555 [Reticulomyxa filosa]
MELIFHQQGCGPLMYAFHVRETVSTEMMTLLIPEQSRSDRAFWERKDKRGSSLLLFAIWNSKHHCTSRVRTLRQFMPEESFQKLVVKLLSSFVFLSGRNRKERFVCLSCCLFQQYQQEPKPLLYAFYFQERIDDELMRMLIPTNRENTVAFWRAKDQVVLFLDIHIKKLFDLSIFVCLLLYCPTQNRNSVIQIAILNKRPECLQRLNMLKKHMQREQWLDLLKNKNNVNQ